MIGARVRHRGEARAGVAGTDRARVRVGADHTDDQGRHRNHRGGEDGPGVPRSARASQAAWLSQRAVVACCGMSLHAWRVPAPIARLPPVLARSVHRPPPDQRCRALHGGDRRMAPCTRLFVLSRTRLTRPWRVTLGVVGAISLTVKGPAGPANHSVRDVSRWSVAARASRRDRWDGWASEDGAWRCRGPWTCSGWPTCCI